MSAARPPSLAGAAWLSDPAVQAVLGLLSGDGEEARVVGGAVRNALAGLPVAEVDIATTAIPDVVEARAASAGLRTVPTGREHGTVTVISDGRPFEVTTLREDIETDGRHAVVRHGRDWKADAERRDFTVNALSAEADGTVHDPLGGYPDLLARRIRFIGEADRRIAEDRLRVLRFFRFHAEFGEGEPDEAGLAASLRARNGLRDLSGERIGQEMKKLVVAKRAPETVTLMQDRGILPMLLGVVADLAAFAQLAEIEEGWGARPSAPLRLAALFGRVAEDIDRTAERLRLSNAEKDRMVAGLEAAVSLADVSGDRMAKVALYRFGETAYRDGVLLASVRRPRGGRASAMEGADEEARRALWSLPDRWKPPRFPLTGADIVALGVPAGPAVGTILREMEAWWIKGDFTAGRDALLARVQQVAAQQ